MAGIDNLENLIKARERQMGGKMLDGEQEAAESNKLTISSEFGTYVY